MIPSGVAIGQMTERESAHPITQILDVQSPTPNNPTDESQLLTFVSDEIKSINAQDVSSL